MYDKHDLSVEYYEPVLLNYEMLRYGELESQLMLAEMAGWTSGNDAFNFVLIIYFVKNLLKGGTGNVRLADIAVVLRNFLKDSFESY